MNKRKFDETMDVKKVKKSEDLQLNILSEDGTVKYDFMTTLQNIVLAKIASNLWMSKSSQEQIVELFHISSEDYVFSNKWQQIEENTVSKVSKLHLPNAIAKKLKKVVPILGESILKWIRYHDKHILNLRKDCKYSAVDYINNIAWSPKGKIDYAQTAKNILAQQNCLSDYLKYKLACICCLEDEISLLAPKFVEQIYLKQRLNIHPMVLFWTPQIKDVDIIYFYNCSNYCSNLSINENIFKFLLNDSTVNEVPIRHIWNYLSENEKGKNIKLLFKKLGNQDWRFTLLSNLDFEQQQQAFKECSYEILGGIINDWMWGEYFLPTILHIMDIIDPSSYLDLLKQINNDKKKYFSEENKSIYNEYKSLFKQLWQSSSRRLKDFIIDHKCGCYVLSLIFSLSWERDTDVIELILNDLSTQQKKNTIFGYAGIERCINLIRTDEWDLLKTLVKYTLSSEEDINFLKRKLIKEKGAEIALYILVQEDLGKLERFMSWAFQSEEEINEFRRYISLDTVVFNNKVDITEL